jgi:hypothetical protein
MTTKILAIIFAAALAVPTMAESQSSPFEKCELNVKGNSTVQTAPFVKVRDATGLNVYEANVAGVRSRIANSNGNQFNASALLAKSQEPDGKNVKPRPADNVYFSMSFALKEMVGGAYSSEQSIGAEDSDLTQEFLERHISNEADLFEFLYDKKSGKLSQPDSLADRQVWISCERVH